MKKTVLIAALVACGFSAFAQTGQPLEQRQANLMRMPALGVVPAEVPVKIALPASTSVPQVQEKEKPKTVVVIRKDPAKPRLIQLPSSTAAVSGKDKYLAEGVLKLPLGTLPAKVKSQDLPGLGESPGDVSDMKIKSVHVGTDRNELVYISLTQLNKISTPFELPQIIDASGATLKAVGQDLFLRPANDKPLTVYITDGGTGQSIGLTLVPKANLPAQSLVLQPDAPVSSAHAKAEIDESGPSDYVSRINSIIKQMALNKTPSGFTRSRLPRSVAASGEVIVEPQYKYAGSTYDLYSYKVRSISTSPIEMKEESFYTDAVRAVAFFPKALLQQNEETMVFVIADRTKKEQQ